MESVEGDGAYYDGCKSLSCGGKGGEKENKAVGSEKGQLMYTSAQFERVIGSRDSEAFYMMKPELSVYFLRV